MEAKRDIPNLIKIDFPYYPSITEDIMMMRFRRNLNAGYQLSPSDSRLFCAILLRKHSVNELPKGLRDYCLENGKIRDSIRFEMVTLGLEKDEAIPEDFTQRYIQMRMERAKARKAVVLKEVGRVIRNAHKLTMKNSLDYNELVRIVTQMNDSLTLIDWFIPIQLTFERYVHIYVKHVEETKFGEGQFKNRSFFDYKHTEILTLIKSVLKSIEDEIKEHFLHVAISRDQPEEELFKGWYKEFKRGWGPHPPLIYDNRKFWLKITKEGIIDMFFQEK